MKVVLMDLKVVSSVLLSGFNKNELTAYKSNQCFESIHLASIGHNDTEGFKYSLDSLYGE